MGKRQEQRTWGRRSSRSAVKLGLPVGHLHWQRLRFVNGGQPTLGTSWISALPGNLTNCTVFSIWHCLLIIPFLVATRLKVRVTKKTSHTHTHQYAHTDTHTVLLASDSGRKLAAGECQTREGKLSPCVHGGQHAFAQPNTRDGLQWHSTPSALVAQTCRTCAQTQPWTNKCHTWFTKCIQNCMHSM